MAEPWSTAQIVGVSLIGLAVLAMVYALVCTVLQGRASSDRFHALADNAMVAIGVAIVLFLVGALTALIG